MPEFADLHIHTNYSDSTSPPEEVVAQAKAAGLKCIAIADHDTVAGIEPTTLLAKEEGIEVIPAVELSTEINGKDVHLLAYLFDYKDPEFCAKLDEMQNSRIERMEEMINKLKEFGINDISLEEVCNLAESKSVGRPHLAAKLVERGHVKDIKDAFNKYLAQDKPGFVPKFKISPHDAIVMVKKSGGISVLAHPVVTNVDDFIPGFVDSGLGGIEVYYPSNSNKQTRYYERIATKYNLCVTGGSDAHGDAKKHTFVGKIKIPYRLVEHLKQAVNA